RPYRKTDARRAGTGIVVAHGYGLKISVQHGHLVVEDGFGRQRRSRRYHRTDRLRRLVVIGRSGYVSLDALRWLKDTGAAFLHIDTDGQLIATSTRSGADLAGLRRVQALAPGTPAGLEVARHVLGEKVAGQRALLDELPDSADVRESLERAHTTITTTTTIGIVLAAEAQAATAYWHAWSALPVRFSARETAKLPGHWLTFNQRASLITGAPRIATNPANAILNYLYALLEAETILACHAVGLDPGLGVFHTDRRDRASLALDLMEAVRPCVDAYLFALLTQRTLSAREFVETREGGCRITPRFAAQLAGTCEAWRAQIAPVVEHAAETFAAHATSRLPSLTPLTGANRRAAWDDRMPDRKQRQSRPGFASLPNTCRECGAPLADRRRRYCDQHRRENFTKAAVAGRAHAADLLAHLRAEQRDPGHGGQAARLRGAKNAAHQAAVHAWNGEQPDPALFRAEILPGLRHLPISILVAATGLSAHYCSMIRLGKTTPHARHWPVLRGLDEPRPTPS
ncbi:MAG: CRISPR-associated endonuclease Cas1, partial [Solirubrobacteraceae bacterium]